MVCNFVLLTCLLLSVVPCLFFPFVASLISGCGFKKFFSLCGLSRARFIKTGCCCRWMVALPPPSLPLFTVSRTRVISCLQFCPQRGKLCGHFPSRVTARINSSLNSQRGSVSFLLGGKRKKRRKI